MRPLKKLQLICAALTLFGTNAAFADDDDAVTAFKVGKVITMNDGDDVINNAVVLVKNGKIEAVGKAKDVEIPDGAEIVEMADAWLVPGMVEAHNHTAGQGLHDYVYLTNPGLRTLDGVDPNEESQYLAQAGGVTTALLISGSGTNMSGFGTVVKFAGENVEDMVMKFPGSIKIAQAGNPERYWYGVGRMLMNYNTRQTMEKAKAYHEAWTRFEKGETSTEPVFDPMWNDFRLLFEKEYPASVHTQIYQVVMTTIDMLANKLDVPTMLDHSTFDGYKTAPLVVENGEIVTINGPRQLNYDRSQRKIFGNASEWWRGGVHKLGINTDSPVVPQEELSFQAAMAVHYGWMPYEALKGVTRIPAEGMKIDDRVGSITPGLDADFCLWSGDPLDPRSVCHMAVINGAIERDVRETDKPRRF